MFGLVERLGVVGACGMLRSVWVGSSPVHMGKRYAIGLRVPAYQTVGCVPKMAL